jgi:hypothetical protein
VARALWWRWQAFETSGDGGGGAAVAHGPVALPRHRRSTGGRRTQRGVSSRAWLRALWTSGLVATTRGRAGPAPHAVVERGAPPRGLPALGTRRREQRGTGVCTRTERRALQTLGPNAPGSRQSQRGEVPQRPRKARKPREARGRATQVKARRAMTARTQPQAAGHKQREETPALPAALHRRRQEALERYRAGAPMAVLCRESGGAKSGLAQWQQRSQATAPAWLQEHSRRPETTPTTTPEACGAASVRLRPTWVPAGSGTVSAGGRRDHLRPRRVASLPSRRTSYRMLKRQAKEVHSHACPASVSGGLSHLCSGHIATGIDRSCTRTGGRALETRGLGAKEARLLWAR